MPGRCKFACSCELVDDSSSDSSLEVSLFPVSPSGDSDVLLIQFSSSMTGNNLDKQSAALFSFPFTCSTMYWYYSM